MQQYFISEVYFISRRLVGRCRAAEGFHEITGQVCTVQYTTDPLYRNLSDKITIPLGIELLPLAVPAADVTYYLLFSVSVNNGLSITDKVVFDFKFPEGKLGVLLKCR